MMDSGVLLNYGSFPTLYLTTKPSKLSMRRSFEFALQMILLHQTDF